MVDFDIQAEISPNWVAFVSKFHFQLCLRLPHERKTCQVYWSRTLTFQKIDFICFSESPLQMMEKVFFISSWKLFSFLSCFNFYHDFFGPVGKQIDKKFKVIFKVYDVIN